MPRRKLSWSTVRRVALATPGVEEGSAHGLPAFRVGGKVIAAFRVELEAMMFTVGFEARERLMRADARAFFFTDHYRNYPCVLARFDGVNAADVRGLLARAIEHRSARRKRPKLAGADPPP